MTGKKTGFIGVRLDPKLQKELEGLSLLFGKSLSDLIREIIEENLPSLRHKAYSFTRTFITELKKIEKSDVPESKILSTMALYKPALDYEKARIAIKSEQFANKFAKSGHAWSQLHELALSYFGFYGQERQAVIRDLLDKIEKSLEEKDFEALTNYYAFLRRQILKLD